MRINPMHVYRQVQQIAQSRGAKAQVPPPSPAQSAQDAFTMSVEAKIFAEAVKRAQDAPDVRMDRVSMVRADLAQGTYGADGLKVAESLLRHAGLSKD